MATVTRHDVALANRNLLAIALSLGLADATDLVCLGASHSGDVPAMLAEIDGWADAERHSNIERRSAWIKARDTAMAETLVRNRAAAQAAEDNDHAVELNEAAIAYQISSGGVDPDGYED
jgi:hypothetical protein